MKNKLTVFYKLDEGAVVPFKKRDSDAGYDVVATSDPEIVGEKLYSGSPHYSNIDYIQYRTGLYVQPIDMKNLVRFDLRPRSSISKYWLTLANTPATIDHEYTGEILVRFRYNWQPSDLHTVPFLNYISGSVNMDKIYKKGDAICQLLPEYVKEIKWVEVTELAETDRGDKGFGSTGN